MGVERVDYYSEDEYQSALSDEAQYWQQHEQEQQEPDVVPCFKCRCQMYQECHAPEGNICSDCKKGEIMLNCCKNQTTTFCPDCGADLEAKSLAGLKKHLAARLATAKKRLDEWIAVNTDAELDGTDNKEKAIQGIARSTDTIVRLESWLLELEKLTRKPARMD